MALLNISRLFGGGLGGGEWTIASSGGSSLLPVYSLLDVDVTMDGAVVSEQIEEGSFESHNKTSAPIQITLNVAFNGSASDLQEALTKVRDLKESVSTFSIVTPYYEFENMTLERFNTKMTVTDGLGVLYCELSCVEIREVAAAYGVVDQSVIQQAQQESPIAQADAANPSDVSAVNTGQSAPASLNTSESAAASPQRESIAYKMANGWM